MLKYIFVLHLTVILSIAEVAKYKGCFWENHDSKRLMPDGYKDFPKGLTKDHCFDFCKKQESSFAGLQYGRECYCSKSRITHMFLSNDTECNVKCNGNRWETCGGRHHLSVYDLEGKDIVSHEDKYVGCFESFSDYKMLSDREWKFTKMLTPNLCIGHCWRNGYKYSGLHEGNTCFCGDNINDDFRRDDSECSMPCSGDSRLKCGAETNLNVYSSGITDITEEGRQIGCFEDRELLTVLDVKLLPGFEFLLPDSNTPRKCLNLCSSLGYKYAGVKFGRLCNCGNKRPIGTLLMSNQECSIPCPGDPNKFCGGTWRIMVYKMGNIADIYETESPITVGPTSLPTHSTKSPQVDCVKSLTTVNGKPVCKGSVIFSDEFNSGIDKTKWFHSVYMPWTPDYDFVVYDNQPENSYTDLGRLVIKPTLMDEDFIRSGKLNLNGCTGEPFSQECERTAISYAILPPIQSAKLTTKKSFSFKYGRVDIKAKLPAGDWLYPEIFLEPSKEIYGKGYQSGKIMIAVARGNEQLYHRSNDIGGRLLEEGIILGNADEIKGRSIYRHSTVLWSSSFHTYSLIWTPDNMRFMIDGKMEETLMHLEEKKLYELLKFQNVSASWSHSKVHVAPFDQESFISIGLTVGGIRKFPDDSISGDYKKPWNNRGTKALVSFLQAKDKWFKTWQGDSATLQIESVTVIAL